MTDNTDQSTKPGEDRLPWRGIAIGGGLLLALFVAAPFIQIWIDSIPREERKPQVPLVSTVVLHNNSTIQLGDGEFVGAGLTGEDYARYIQLLRAGDFEGVRQMYRDGDMIKLVDGTELTVIEGGPLLSEVRPRDGRHKGVACWIASEFVGLPQ